MMSTKNNEPQLALVDGYTFERRENTPEFYVDGLSEAFIGLPVSKLTLHSVRGIEGGKEHRVSVVQISISTTALLEMCRNILAQGVVAAPQMDHGFEQARGQLKHVLNGVNFSVVTPMPPLQK